MFGGNEYNESLGINSYDFGERNYSPELGKWMNLDLLAEFMRNQSPYNFGFNNPVYFSDYGGTIPWPVPEMFKNWKRRIDSWFGPRNCEGCSKFHKGLDINFSGGGNTDYGAPVVTTHSGRVILVKTTTAKGNGRTIEVESPDGSFKTRYLHLKSIVVQEGQEISEGQSIGLIGGSANGKEFRRKAHLHYEIYRRDVRGKYIAYNPTEGKGNSPSNLVDPQLWIHAMGPHLNANTYDFGFNGIRIPFMTSEQIAEEEANKKEEESNSKSDSREPVSPVPVTPMPVTPFPETPPPGGTVVPVIPPGGGTPPLPIPPPDQQPDSGW